MRVLMSPKERLVPKSEILTESLSHIRMLREGCESEWREREEGRGEGRGEGGGKRGGGEGRGERR